MLTEFLENRLAIDIKDCSEETILALQDFFEANNLKATWFERNNYALETWSDGWLYIVYEEHKTLNGRKQCVNYDMKTIPSVKAEVFLDEVNWRNKVKVEETDLEEMFV